MDKYELMSNAINMFRASDTAKEIYEGLLFRTRPTDLTQEQWSKLQSKALELAKKLWRLARHQLEKTLDVTEEV